jgi:hypothetical protein
VEREQDKQKHSAARRPIRLPDSSMIEGQKPQATKPDETASKYSGGLLKPGQGEHFEREQTRMNRYKGIEAMPRSDGLEERLNRDQSSSQQQAKVKSGCFGLLMVAGLIPLAALLILHTR